jgi:phosphatidylglycerophosphate synthase
MSERSERVVADIALVAALVLSFVTHESGALLHSLVSLVFTGLLFHHVKHNWAAYRRPSRRSKWAANHTVALLMVATIVTGLTLWIAGGDYALAHGPLSVAAAIAVVPHLWVHRRAAMRLLRRLSRARSASVE